MGTSLVDIDKSLSKNFFLWIQCPKISLLLFKDGADLRMESFSCKQSPHTLLYIYNIYIYIYIYREREIERERERERERQMERKRSNDLPILCNYALSPYIDLLIYISFLL